MKIKCLLSLFLIVLSSVAYTQILNLKKGQKFDYEALNNSEWHNQSLREKECEYWRIKFEVLSYRNGIYTLKASPEVFITGNNHTIIDSTRPANEQPRAFMAIVNRVLTQSSYILQVNEMGDIKEVGGLPEIRNKILAKLRELQVSDGDQTHQERAESSISDRRIKELSSFFTGLAQHADPGTGLILSGKINWEQTPVSPTGVQQDTIFGIYKFSLIRSNDKFVKISTPLLKEAKAALAYEKYYSSKNQAKRSIQGMIEALSHDKGSQTIQDKIMKQLATLDKRFAKNDFEYLGLKLTILTYLNTSYYEILTKVPYKFLPSENDVLNKLAGELGQANFSNVTEAVKLCFTGFSGEDFYPMDTIYTSSLIHDKFGRLVHRIKDPDSLQAALTIFNQIDQLQIPGATEMLKGMKTYIQAKLATGQPELAAIANTYFNSPFDKAGRYRILIYDELNKKQIPDSIKRAYIEYTIDLNQKKLEALQTVTEENKRSLPARYNTAHKIIYKKNLADAYYRKSCLQKNTELTYLQLAADYLPTPADITLNAEGLKTEYEFSPFASYTDFYLAAAGNDKLTDEERFSKYVDMVILEPDRYSILKDNYAKAFPQGDFRASFSAALKSKLPSTPQFSLNERMGTLVTSKDQQGMFVFVDFWGTWCGACVSEIDKIEAIHRKNPAPDKLMVTTIACYDKKKNVDDFMAKEKYTYQVLMSDAKVEKDFKVESYPTKLLLLPNGVYLTIPYADDYNSILMKYLKWEI